MLLPDIGYPQTNQVVEPGYYVCMMCPEDHDTKEANNTVITLNKKGKLPKCPKCNDTYWMKI